MANIMTSGQREFWEAVQTLARVTRRGKNVCLAAVADALALEQEIQARLDAAQQVLPAMELAPAEFLGWQEGFEGAPGFPLFNLTKDIPGHSAGSSVSADTLTQAGYAVPSFPPRPTQAQERAR